MKILKINSSVQSVDTSVSRQLVEKLISSISSPIDEVIDRDLTKGVSLITGELIGAFYTPPEVRTDAQNELLQESDQLIKEMKESDVIVMGIPIYNFSVPGSVKAYIDLISRTGVTFKYNDMGQVTGLIGDKKVYIIVASGGTPFRSEVDFVSDYMKHIFSFWGITDVNFIDVTQQMTAENVLEKANETIENYSKAHTIKA